MGKTKTTKKVDNSFNPANPDQPISLKRIDELKRKLVGNEDHVAEVLEWERKAKRALLTISLKKHQGVRIFLAGIVLMIKETNELLQNAKSGQLSDSERNGLIDKRDFMVWIITFFNEASEDLKSIEEELEYEMDGEVEADLEEDDPLEDLK